MNIEFSRLVQFNNPDGKTVELLNCLSCGATVEISQGQTHANWHDALVATFQAAAVRKR